MSLHESFQKKVTLISTASVELARACAVFNAMARKLSVRNSQIQLEHEKNTSAKPQISQKERPYETVKVQSVFANDYAGVFRKLVTTIFKK